MSDTNSLLPQQMTADLPPTSGDATAKILDTSGHALLERLGFGGMGEVYRFGDEALQRDLAIKILKEELRGNADAEERFLREARLTGSLQHPGVVPIHNLSRLADGRPCYTMKLVRGRTFADMLRDEPDGPERLPRLLAILEKVCQTVAYAHSKHVIHRDLKPSNVMVGEFGEVQVMDWGLAKQLHFSEPAPLPEATADVATAAWTKEGEGLSRAGLALGTPEYMPPEQAVGDWDIVDERADVFALGAVLCAVLTGRPPYFGLQREDLLRRARRGNLAEALARLERCGADAELVALCRECLAPEREGRPRHAGQVSERLASYQAEVRERLRQVELERAAAEVQAREERKRRWLTAGLAAAVLALVLLGGGGAWQLERQQAERRAEQARHEEHTLSEVETALAKVRVLQKQARWAEAEVILEQAASRLSNTGPDDHQQLVKQAQTDLRLVAALDRIRLEKATPVEGWWNPSQVAPAYAKVFRDHGLDVTNGDVAEVAERIASSAIKKPLVAALDDWASVERNAETTARLMAIARQADPDAWMDQFRDPATWRDPQAFQHLAAQADVTTLSPTTLAILGESLRTSGGDAVGLLKRAQRRYPDDFWLNLTLGSALKQKERAHWEEAIGYYRAALAVRPQSVTVYVYLAAALQEKGQLEEAIAALRQALEFDSKLVPAHYNLGNALQNKGDLDGAIAEYRRVLELDSKFLPVYRNLGNALANKRNLQEAMAVYRRALELDPNDAKTHVALGLALQERGDVAEAIAAYRRALKLDSELGIAHGALGQALLRQGRFAEARVSLQRALDLLPPNGPVREPMSLLIQLCEPLSGLEPRLPAILQGDDQLKDATERLSVAFWCQQYKKHYAISARLYAAAFAVEPNRATDLNAQHRYNAACCAALAATGEGQDARLLPDKVAVMFRRWALSWLHDDLEAYAKLAGQNKLAANKAIQQRLAHWRSDPDLASVRDPQALDRLPANERAAWQSLWRDVDELAKRAAKQAKAGEIQDNGNNSNPPKKGSHN